MTTDPTPPADPAGPPVGRPPVEPAAVAPAAPAADPAAVPDEATLAEIATPATVRRAPRFGAFVRTGVLLGGVLGWLLAILFSGGTVGEGRTGVILISTVAGAGFGALLAAGCAALADRRSTRPARAAAAGRRPGR